MARTFRKGTRFYAVSRLCPWTNVAVSAGGLRGQMTDDHSDPCVGFMPVYISKRAALKAYPGSILTEIRRVEADGG